MKNLSQPHMFELVEFVKRLRQRYKNGYVPDFDPDDGGVNAEILFLFEKPGPMTDPVNKGSGFISQDNNDLTANATKNFIVQAGIDRKKIVIWNLISAWNGKIKFSAKEKIYALEEFQELLSILKKVKSIILVGKEAQKIEKKIDLSNYKVLKSYHPSPKVKSINPNFWKTIPNVWQESLLDDDKILAKILRKFFDKMIKFIKKIFLRNKDY